MLPTSNSSHSLHTAATNNLGLPLPPRSTSSANLSAHGYGSIAVSRSDTPVSYRRSSTSAGNPTTSSSQSIAPSRDSQPTSPRLPYASTPTGLSAGSTSYSHHGNYDAKLVASTINRIESTSGIGAPGYAVGNGGFERVASTSGSIVSNSSSIGNQGPESDEWTAVCVRTLPLFNGEGQRGYIEDLNDLVSLHIKKTIERLGSNSQVITNLTNELSDLLAMGMLTLNAKLTDLSDDKLLIRITEVWNFFFIGCLPYIEGIFLPLRTDGSVRQIVNTSFGRSLLSSNSTSAKNRVVESIDIRRTALRTFRDHLVLPIVDRLAILFSSVPNISGTQPVEPSTHPLTTSNISATARTASSRRLQMVSILISIQTNDERQSATEALGKALRVGMERRPSLVPTANSNANSPTNTRANSLSRPPVGSFGGGGLYGTPHGLHSLPGQNHGMMTAGQIREAEKKGWRRGRQIIQSSKSLSSPSGSQGSAPGLSQHNSHNSVQSTGINGASTEPSVRKAESSATNTASDQERRYLESLRSPDIRSVTPSSKPSGENRSHPDLTSPAIVAV